MGIAERRHRVTLDEPGPQVPDPDGGWMDTWVPLTPPTWFAAITQPTIRAHATYEGVGGGSVIAQATHIITGHYHPGISTQTRITYGARTFNALYVANVEERNRTTEIVAAEIVK